MKNIRLTAVVTTKINLIPLGNISFSFKRKTKDNVINVGDVKMYHENSIKITDEQIKKILKVMKKAKTDLLTDGFKFYTTTNNAVTQIDHDKFRELFNSEFAGLVPDEKVGYIEI